MEGGLTTAGLNRRGGKKKIQLVCARTERYGKQGVMLWGCGKAVCIGLETSRPCRGGGDQRSKMVQRKVSTVIQVKLPKKGGQVWVV